MTPPVEGASAALGPLKGQAALASRTAVGAAVVYILAARTLWLAAVSLSQDGTDCHLQRDAAESGPIYIQHTYSGPSEGDSFPGPSLGSAAVP